MGTIRKWLMPVALISSGCLFIAGCGQGANSPANQSSEDKSVSTEQPVDGGTLTISTTSDIVTLNPAYIQDTASGDCAQFIYANLFNLDRNGNLVADAPALAASDLQVSPDSKTYTVKLKDNAKWSDGQPVTADDVVFTVNAMKNPAYASPLITAFSKVKSATKLDDHTVRITLNQVYAPFNYALYTPILPYHVLKDVPPAKLQSYAYGTDPSKTVSNGPWKWTGWTQKQFLKFDADPNYWGPKPHIQTIIYKVYASQSTEVQGLLKGDTDFDEAIPVTQISAVKARQNVSVIVEPSPTYEFVDLNFKPSNFPDGFVPWATQKTRQAMAYAINRQGLITDVLKGTGRIVNSPFEPGTWADPGDAAVNYNYDPAKAKQLLADDGWKAGPDGILTKNGHKFTFDLVYNTGNSRREQVAAVIQQNLKDVGIQCNPKALDFSSLIANYYNVGKFEAGLAAWAYANPDPDQETTFSSKYFPPNGQNQGWYKNPKLDALWVQGYSTTDQAKRKQVYKEVAKEISTDLPYIFLYQYGLPAGYSTRVHYKAADKPQMGLPYGYMFHIQDWWVTDQKGQ